MNTENNVNQNVIKPNVEDNKTSTNSPNNNEFIYKPKKKHNLLIMVVIAIIIGILYLLFKSSGVITDLAANSTPAEQEIINVETGIEWADKYATYIQSMAFYSEVDKFDLTFIDFNIDSTPEAIIKYTDDTEATYTIIIQLNGSEISETKNFSNATFKILFNSEDNTTKWYIYISSDNKYGSYTQMSKILSGNVKSADIKATTDNEITSFAKQYIVGDYTINYYEISKDNFKEDYQTITGRYDEYNEKINSVISELEENIVENKTENPTNSKTYLEIGELTLTYGTYVTKIPVTELGEEVGYTEKYIILNNDDTVTIDDETISLYPPTSEDILLSNGTSIKVKDNNVFIYEDREYTLKE